MKAFARQDLEQSRMDEASRAQVDAALKARRVKSLLSPVVNIVIALCTAIVIWHGAALILAGAMTVGALTVFLAYLSKFFKPVQDLAKMTSSIAQAAVGLERIRKILDTDIVIPERENAKPLPACRGEITFENVAFGYDPEAPVLKDVSFTITPGQLVGIVGTTGGGKSTVVSLIPRFYDPTGGRVLIDGVDLRDLELASLRAKIGYVLQDTVLFHGTVRENIAYGRPECDRGGDRRRRQARQRPRVHHRDAARLRHDGRRPRPHAVGRPAAAHRHREGGDPRHADPDPRRADGGARHRVRAAGDRGTGAADEGPHGHHDRAPAFARSATRTRSSC